MMKRHRWSITLAVSLVACFLVLQEVAVRRAEALSNDTYQELDTFASVLAIVQKNYVEPVTTKRLIDGAISGMLLSPDPHSAYLTPDLYRDLEVETRGSFGGLGIEITIKNGALTVVAPIEDTPAYRAGLKAGDQIIKIDDDFTKDMSLTEAVKRMRGPKGSKIRLTLHRNNVPELFTVTLARDVIKIQSVKSKMLPEGYGYIRVTDVPGEHRRRRREGDRRVRIEGPRQDQGNRVRPARQSGRLAEPGGKGVGRFPRWRADRLYAGPRGKSAAEILLTQEKRFR